MAYKKEFSKLGTIYTVMTVLVIIVQTLIGILFSDLPLIRDNLNLNVIITTSSFYIVATILLYFTMAVPNKEIVPIPKVKLNTKRFISIFLSSYFLMIVGNLIGLSFTGIISSFKSDSVDNIILDVMTQISPFTAILLAVILAPIFEEIFFRKFILDRLHPYGNTPAIFISGLMFGLFHANANQFFYAFFLGMLLAYVYLNYGEIKYCIIIHMMVNSVGSIAAFFMNDEYLALVDELSLMDSASEAYTEFVMQNMGVMLPAALFNILVFGLIIGGIIAFIKNIKTFKAYINYSKQGQKITIKDSVLNLGILLFIAVCLIQIILQLFM